MPKPKSDFWAAYLDPRWQRRRLEIMERADFKCEECGTRKVTLNVHHRFYVKGRQPWEYADTELMCLCEKCHASVTAQLQELREIAGRLGSGVGTVLGFAKAELHKAYTRMSEDDPEPLSLDNWEQAEGFALAVCHPRFIQWLTERLIHDIGSAPLTPDAVERAIQSAFEMYANHLSKSQTGTTYAPDANFFAPTETPWRSPLVLAPLRRDSNE